MSVHKPIVTLDSHVSKKIHETWGMLGKHPFVMAMRFIGDQKGYPIVFLFSLIVGLSLLQSVLLTINLVVLTIFMMVLKLKVRRQRPIQKQENLHIFDEFSFPSGHAGRIGTILTYFVVFHGNPILMVLAIVWGFIVCLQRVASGEHYLMDVIVGLFLGFIVAYLPMSLLY